MAGRFQVLPSIVSCWQITAWDCLALNAWQEEALWNILLQTRMLVETVRHARCDAHPRIRIKKEHATCVSVAGKKQPTNIPHRFDVKSCARDERAWASIANYASASNPYKIHVKSKTCVFAEVCQHCTSNGYTDTRTISASHVKGGRRQPRRAR